MKYRSNGPLWARVIAPLTLAACSAGLLLIGGVRSQLCVNTWSRLLTIESIVERHTLAITDAPLLKLTLDRIKVYGEFYSDKPPLLSAIGALVYWPVYKMGYTLSPRIVERRVIFHPWVISGIMWVLVGWSLSAGLAAFRSSLGSLRVHWAEKELLGAACVISSLLFVYVATLNNHTVAASLVMGAWCILVRPSQIQEWSLRRFFGLGFLLGLAAAIDMATGALFAVAMVPYLRLRGAHWRQLVWYVSGTFGPALAHCILQMQITPTPLPSHIQREYWLYEGSYWLNPMGFDANSEPPLLYLAHMLVGPRGWLTLTPTLIWGLCYMLISVLRPNSRFKAEARLMTALVAILLIYYAFFTGFQNYGGHCFGMRWFIAFTPPVLFFSCVAYTQMRYRFLKVLFWLTVALSLVYAVHGARRPWYPVSYSKEPPVVLLQKLVLVP